MWLAATGWTVRLSATAAELALVAVEARGGEGGGIVRACGGGGSVAGSTRRTLTVSVSEARPSSTKTKRVVMLQSARMGAANMQMQRQRERGRRAKIAL